MHGGAVPAAVANARRQAIACSESRRCPSVLGRWFAEQKMPTIADAPERGAGARLRDATVQARVRTAHPAL
jgi:hypothetical protein